MKLYTDGCKWAVFFMIGRKTQDNRRDKLHVIGVFTHPDNAENFIATLPAETQDRFHVGHVDELDRIEEFYNFIQDLKDAYGDYWIYSLDEKYFSVDEHAKYRTLFRLWTN